MDNMLRNSLPAKIGYAFMRAWRGCILHKMASGFSKLWHKSRTRRVAHRFLSIPSTLVYSRFYKLLNNFNGMLFNLGEKLRPAVDSSKIFKLCRKFSASAFVEKSVILSSLKKLGMRGLLLVAFAMYLPLDVLIRDVIGIAALSSIWDEAFMLFCVGYILWDMVIIKRERIKPSVTPLDAPLFFFICASLFIMAVVSPKLSIAIAGYRAVCQFMLWFFVLTRLLRSERDVKILYFSVCIMAVCVAFHSIYQYIVGVEIPSTWVAASEMGVRTRAFSITGSPNILGSLMVLCAPMIAALIYYVKPLWLKLCMWALTIVMCLATLVTFSRGAWFGLAVAVVLFCLLVDRKLLLIAAVGAGALIMFVPEISNRITFLFTSDFAAANSAGGRAQRWAIGWTLLRTNPIFGFGLGRFGGAIAMQNQVMEGIDYFYMDNYYMKTLVEMGYAGLSAYIYLLVQKLLWSVRGIFKTRKNPMSLLTRGMLCGMVGVLSHSFFENIFEVPYMNAYFWGFAAVIMCVSFLRRKAV